MELRHLRYFVAVAEEENITRAAERLHVSQPPLSRQVRDLEEELGVRLLERSAKSVRLTEAGRVFLEESRAVLARAEEARERMRAFGKGKVEEIHVGYAPSLTVELLPHALREFQKGWPLVRVTLHDFSTEQMLSGLREGRLDLALTIKPGRGVGKGLQFHELRRYGVRLAVGPGHRLAGKGTVKLLTAARERLVGYTRRDYPEYGEWLRGVFGRVGVVPALSEEHDSVTSLIAAVESGRGVALVPESFGCFAGDRLKLLGLDPATETFAVGVVWRKGDAGELVAGFMAAAGVRGKQGARSPGK